MWPKSEKTGAYSFNKLKLADLAALPPVQAILGYKKYATLLSTFGESLQQKICPATENIHCSFTVGETRTGRLSSRNPNLQNMPARDESFRHIFVASPGYKLVVADFSQVEIRVAGEVSGDPVIRKAFRDGIDLHKSIVADISNKKIEDVTKEERQLGKALNFGLLFGMGPKKLQVYAKASYRVDMSQTQAEKAHTVYHAKYRHYSSWCNLQRVKCKTIGFVRTPSGKMRKLLEEEVYTKAINTPVQGGAAEVSFAALIALQDMRNHFGFNTKDIRIINTVHDEIVVECKDNLVDVTLKIVNLSMNKGMLTIFPEACVTGLAEAKVGDSWAEAK
jgi:DNA polymerase-1